MISLNTRQRIRQESGSYKDKKYQAIKKSMNVLDQFHSILLKEEEDGHFTLIAGFLRFCSAIDLKWEFIRGKIYTNLSKYAEILIEILENVARINFTSYEFYVGIGVLKEEYEKHYPDAKRGKYSRSVSKNNNHKSNTAPGAVMISQTKSFVAAHSELLGLSERFLFEKTRISEAIKQDRFDAVTLNLIKNGEIPQKRILKVLTRLDSEDKRKKAKTKTQETRRPFDIEKMRNETIDNFVQSGIDYAESQKLEKKPEEKNANKSITLIPENYNKMMEDTKERTEESVTVKDSENYMQDITPTEICPPKKTKKPCGNLKAGILNPETLPRIHFTPSLPKNKKDLCISCPKALVKAVPYESRNFDEICESLSFIRDLFN